MRSLNASTRVRAIEIANQLLEKEQPGKSDKERIIAISIDEARRWARCRQRDLEVLFNQVQSFV